jgi:hypothetical protein
VQKNLKELGLQSGNSNEAVSHINDQEHEVLGLKGAKWGLRFPKWRVTSDGGLLSELPRLFDLLGSDPGQFIGL